MSPICAPGEVTERSSGCVLFATMEFHPTNPGGAGVLIHHTVRLLLERGFTVVLLFDGGRAAYEQLVNVDRLTIPYAHRFLIHLIDDLCQDLAILPEPCADIAIAKSLRLDHALRKLTEIYDVDLVELYDYCGHGFHYLAQPPKNRPPVAVRLHSTIELLERKTRAPLAAERQWLYAMERAQLVLADVVLSPGTAYYEEDMRPLYSSLTADRVMVSPPVHMSIGEVEYAVESRDVVFYGRLTTLKGLDTFLRAAVLALADPAFQRWLGRFILIGPEDHVSTALSPGELHALIPPAHADRFQFTGRLHHAALLDRLRTVAFACFANRVESFCYAAHELHTAGIPLIVNRIPAFEDGFEEGVSAIFFDGTALDLADRMKHLAWDKSARIALSRHGKERGPRYWVDHYTDLLERMRRERALVNSLARMTGSAIILSEGNAEATQRTVANLSPLPLRPVILEVDAAGELAFAGSRWRGAAEAADSETPLGLQRVGDASLFVRAGDVVEAEWAHEALRVLAQNPRVGAVGGWVGKHTGLESMVYLYIPELAHVDEPGLRVMLRVPADQTLAEYLHGWSGQSERSHLLAHRASALVSVELPRLAVDARGAVDLPTVPDAARAVDFDRFSREFLALVPAAAQATAATATNHTPPESDEDILATTMMLSLVVVRKWPGSIGELWIIRVLRGDHFTELDWSAVMRNGDWVKKSEPDAPAGVQMTVNGSMRFHARGRTGVELLFGPFCGGCEIVHRGRVHVVDLNQVEVRSQVIWLDELASGRSAGVGWWMLPAPASSLKPEHAALKAGGAALVVIAPLGGSRASARLRFRTGCCALTPEELGLLAADGPAKGIAYGLELIRHVGCRKIAIDAAMPGGAELAEQLLRATDDTQIIALLGERPPLGSGGAIAAYRGLGPWLRLASRFAARFAASSTSEGLIGLFARCGARVFPIPAALPAFPALTYPDSTAIEVIVLAGTATIANTAHLITAAAHARMSGLNISRVWLPAHDEVGAKIARSFAAAPEIEGYENVDTAFAGEARRRVALAVFPDDDEMPEAAAFALERGALPILGPASAFARSASLRDALSVTYWEDAIAIAKALARTAEQFDRLAEEYERFRQAQERDVEAGIAALVDEPLPECSGAAGEFAR